MSPSENNFAPSFDCTKATSKPEFLICNNAVLAAADIRLNKIYSDLKKSSPNSSDLKKSQLQWIKQVRNVCDTVDCMLNVYQLRTNQLQNNAKE